MITIAIYLARQPAKSSCRVSPRRFVANWLLSSYLDTADIFSKSDGIEMNPTWRRGAQSIALRVLVRHGLIPGSRHGRRLWLIDLLGPRAVISDCGQHAMPTTLTAICIQIVSEISTSTTWAPTARKTPTQKTSSDCWPHLMSGRNIGHSRPRQSRGRNLLMKKARTKMDEAVGCQIGLVVGIERTVDP